MLLDRVCYRGYKGLWLILCIYFGLYGFGILILPGVIHHWDASHRPVSDSVRQFALDASGSFAKTRFTLCPFMLLLGIGVTLRARRFRKQQSASIQQG